MQEIKTKKECVDIVCGIKTELILIYYYISQHHSLTTYLNNINTNYKSILFYKFDTNKLKEEFSFPIVSILKKGKLLVEFKFKKNRDWTIITKALDKL